MSYVVDVLPAVIETLEGIDGVGAVNSYPRHSKFVETHKDYFQASDNKFRGWIVDRNAAPSTGAPGTQVFRHHSIVLFGYWAVKDSAESSNDFQQEIDNVLAIFDAVVTLNETDIKQLGTPNLVTKIEEMFGGVLCHTCEIILVMTEDTTP